MATGRLRSVWSVLQGAGILFTGTMVTQVLTGLLYLLAAREILPAGYGAAAAVASLAILAVAICDFGGATYALRERSAGRISTTELLEWQRSKGALVLAVAPMAGLLSTWAGGHFSLSTVGAATLLFVCNSFALIKGIALRAALRFGALVGAAVVSRIPGVCLIVFLAWTGHVTGDLLVLLLAINSGLEALFYQILERRLVDLGDVPDRLRWVNPYRSSIGVGVSASVNSLGTLDITLVRAAAGAAVAGEYAAVNRWMGPIGLASQAVTQAVFPRLSAARSADRQSGLVNALIIISLSLPIVGLIALSAPWLVSTFLGDAYAGSVHALQLLCLAIVLAMACQPLSAALVAWRLEKHAAASVFIGLVVQLGSQVLLSRQWGAAGTASGAALGQAVTALTLLGSLAWTRSRWEAAAPEPAVVEVLDINSADPGVRTKG